MLLVEDDPSDERLALRAFAKSNVKCKVDVVRDGVEAVEYLTAPRTENPHLILLDLKLPKKNGHEVLKWIRSNDRTKRIPVVCFTSSSEQADVMGCFESGANSFVRKAVDYHDYMARFAKLAEYWLSINEPC
ncbi:MAG TPA: response regulator [Fimbriimonas sp.]|nr:response regulator [Fimbriimonas sp.]